MKTVSLLTGLAMVALIGAHCPASAQNKMMSMKKGGAVSDADKRFVMIAGQAGNAEVQLGMLAEKQGGSAVKKFGEQMVSDHGKANNKLKQIAIGKGIVVPGDVSAEDKAVMNKLMKLHGAAFDSKYIETQREGHLKVAQIFSKEAHKGTDTDIKSFASDTLPTVKMHYRMLISMSGSPIKNPGIKSVHTGPAMSPSPPKN